MGTRSNIIAKHADGRWGRIYCHWDGYPEYVGATLLRHYTDQEKIETLIALGDLSSLGSELAPPEGVAHGFGHAAPNVCVAYGRDRGEEGTEPSFYDALDAALLEVDDWALYVYVWDGEAWSYNARGEDRAPLTPEVCGL